MWPIGFRSRRSSASSSRARRWEATPWNDRAPSLLHPRCRTRRPSTRLLRLLRARRSHVGRCSHSLQPKGLHPASGEVVAQDDVESGTAAFLGGSEPAVAGDDEVSCRSDFIVVLGPQRQPGRATDNGSRLQLSVMPREQHVVHRLLTWSGSRPPTPTGVRGRRRGARR